MTVYLYGFVPSDQPPPPDDLAGIARRPVRLIEVEPVRAVVSEVPSDEFRAEAVEERLHDLDWVSEQGALHERVVTWFVDHGEILPARFLTLYSDEERLREVAGGSAEEIASRLDALRGLREWDLKVSCREDVLRTRMGEVSDRVAELDRELEDAGPGRRYLLERKREAVVREESSGAARRLAREALEDLAARAAEHRRLPVPSGVDQAAVVLNAALLAPLDAEEGLRADAADIAERLGPLGLDLELTGPWAPYRFLSEDDETDEPGAGEHP